MINKHTEEDFLDILFRDRNKAYGAYALRKDYNHRLQKALGISLGVAMLVFLIAFLKNNGNDRGPSPMMTSVTPIVIVDKTDDPDKEKSKPQKKADDSQSKYLNNIKLVPDNIKPDIPDIDRIDSSQISNVDKQGPKTSGNADTTISKPGGDDKNLPQGNDNKPIFINSAAKFPGGIDAFAEFLHKYLVTPDELQAGEIKKVIVRFKVDIDGAISQTEIMQSGGERFDKEVLRALRKMPKWIPAEQNGNKVATYFTQPVTFVGIEE